MPYNYSDSDILTRVASGKDAERRRDAEKWALAATQPPHEDDAAALQKLQDMSGMGTPGAGYATMDAKNYGRMLLGKITGTPVEYGQAHDGGGLLKSLGGVLKVAAPVAGALIPGVGTLGALAIGAGGSAAGGALSGDKFNLGKTLLAGGAAAAGNKLLGNGLGSTIPKAPGISGMGDALNHPAGIAAGAAGGGALGKLGGLPWDKIIGGGAALGGFLDARGQNAAASDFANAQLELKKRQLDMAEKDYAAREPLRTAAFSRLGKMASGPIGSQIYGRAA